MKINWYEHDTFRIYLEKLENWELELADKDEFTEIDECLYNEFKELETKWIEMQKRIGKILKSKLVG